MKKFLFISLTIFISSIAYCQNNNVTGVFGVKFGDNLQTVKNIIYNNTGKEGKFNLKTRSLTYTYLRMGEIQTFITSFYFNSENKLISVVTNIFISEDDWTRALNKYNEVKSLYSQKYSNVVDVNVGNGIKINDANQSSIKYQYKIIYKKFTCGTSVITGFYNAPISVELEKSQQKSHDGSLFSPDYYIIIRYYEDIKKANDRNNTLNSI